MTTVGFPDYRSMLVDDVVPFWLAHGLDRGQGGLITSLDRDGTPYDTDKSVWFQGRFGWLLGTLCAEIEPREEWLVACRSCVEFLQKHCFDADGRMFFSVTRDGRPLRKRRYAFSEMFAAMAFAAWYAATGEDDVAHLAITVFERGMTRMQSPGGIAPKVIPETRPVASFGGPMIILGTAQAIRSSLARRFTAGDPRLDWLSACVESAIDEIRCRFVRSEVEAVMETVRADGTPFFDHADGRLVNPGHAMEGAWFIMAEGVHRDDRSLIKLGATMLRWTWRHGWDEECGGIRYFCDVLGRPCPEYWHDMKFWWPHNEAIIATLMAWQLTGDDTFGRWHVEVRDWALDHFADDVHGEWYGWLRRDGLPTHRAKGSLWKGPFHLPRMCLACWKLTEGRPVF